MTALDRFESLPDRLLTIGELASYLSTTERHLRRLVYEKRIPYLKVGHFIRFHPGAISRWLSENHHDAS